MQERDTLKDEICARYQVHLELLRATGSGKKKRMDIMMRKWRWGKPAMIKKAIDKIGATRDHTERRAENL